MRLVRLLFSLSFLAMCGAGVLGFAVALAFVEQCTQDLPDHRALKDYVPRLGSRIEAADGSFLSRRAAQRRTYAPYATIPPIVVNAFIPAEDRNYRTHNGVDPLAMARAAFSSAFGGVASGASTITQQVAKNLLVGSERSLVRKVREAVLSMRMDRDLGKDRVLEIYLNEIYLGLGAYGVAEAADTYFGKGLSQLDASEAAVLAAMPKAPSAFNPVRNPRRALERRNYVLRRMAEDGYLAADEARARMAEPIRMAERKGESQGGGQGGWFEDAGWRAAEQAVGPEAIAGQDVVVKTTERPAMQAAAEAALRRGIVKADQSLGWRGPIGKVLLPVDWANSELDEPQGAGDFRVAVVEKAGAEATLALSTGERVVVDREGLKWTGAARAAAILAPGDVVLVDAVENGRARLAQKPKVDGAMVVVDPRSGDVLAMVGGFDHVRVDGFNRATQAKRQPGSAFKPVVYAAALELGYDATTPLLDAPVVLAQGPGQEDWRPRDAKSAGKGGLISVRSALEKSRNMATVRVVWNIGLDDVEAMAKKLGFSIPKMTYASALGASEVTPMQLAMAYSAFANGGRLPTPRLVTEIAARGGSLLKRIDGGPGVQAVDPVAAAQMALILRGVPERGTAARAFAGFGHPVSGKTGTTNSARDAWFVAFAGDFVGVVWIGNNDNSPLAEGETGGMLAAPVMRDFLDAVGAAVYYAEPVVPEGLEKVVVDPQTGLPAKTGVEELLRPERAAEMHEVGPPSARRAKGRGDGGAGAAAGEPGRGRPPSDGAENGRGDRPPAEYMGGQ